MNFQVGQRVRSNVGYRYGQVGVIVGTGCHVWMVRFADGAVREMTSEMLIDLYANNGD